MTDRFCIDCKWYEKRIALPGEAPATREAVVDEKRNLLGFSEFFQACHQPFLETICNPVTGDHNQSLASWQDRLKTTVV